MTGQLLYHRNDLEALFDELAHELAGLDRAIQIVMVGGAWLLWHAQRASTRDVDSARRFDIDIREAVNNVAARHDLSHDWVNDAAAGSGRQPPAMQTATSFSNATPA